MSFLIEKFVLDNVLNPRLSDVRTALSTVGGVIEEIFTNDVAMIIATNFITERTVAPGPVVFTDGVTNRIVASIDLAAFPGGAAGAGLFFYIWNGKRMNLVSNNLNYRFQLQYQLVYTSREETKKAALSILIPYQK